MGNSWDVNAYAMWWLVPLWLVPFITATAIERQRERQRKAEALRQQFYVIEGGKRA